MVPRAIQQMGCDMAASSPRDAALGNIISLVTIACISGLFFMQGVVNAVRGVRLLTWLFFLCMPYFALCIVILSRRLLRDVR